MTKMIWLIIFVSTLVDAQSYERESFSLREVSGRISEKNLSLDIGSINIQDGENRYKIKDKRVSGYFQNGEFKFNSSNESLTLPMQESFFKKINLPHFELSSLYYDQYEGISANLKSIRVEILKNVYTTIQGLRFSLYRFNKKEANFLDSFISDSYVYLEEFPLDLREIQNQTGGMTLLVSGMSEFRFIQYGGKFRIDAKAHTPGKLPWKMEGSMNKENNNLVIELTKSMIDDFSIRSYTLTALSMLFKSSFINGDKLYIPLAKD
ncbi:MAG: hypothetical protein HON90_00855 [Halobacteriovoraceae bacterium]|nr:hypothetical protein [Halobacteriovoraceae bacterium]